MRILILLLAIAACNAAPNRPSSDQPSDAPPPVQTRQATTPVESTVGEFSPEYLMGKFDPATHQDFTLVPAVYADREGLYLRKDVLNAYLEMYKAAKADGIRLQIRSATRNFDYQKGIWERKWTGATKVEGKDLSKTISDPVARARKILEFSSMPGTSRHHWGTDFDLNAFENSYFESGVGLEVYQWLTEHAPDYGFCQVYSEKGPGRPYGYNLEKWHWSYLPVAQELTRQAGEKLTDAMISGFQGAEAAPKIGVIEKYVLGINPRCAQ